MHTFLYIIQRLKNLKRDVNPLCYTEYNEKTRLDTAYHPDKLFKNAVAAIYKAAAVAKADRLHFFSRLFV